MKNMDPKVETETRPSAEEIAACAYLIWEQEGRPEGRAVEHWIQAEEQLATAHAHNRWMAAGRNQSMRAEGCVPPPHKPGRMTMKTNGLDFETLMEARQKAVTESIRKIGIADLDALLPKSLPKAADLRATLLKQLRKDCRTDVLHLAEAGDGMRVVYCRRKQEGIWFQPEGGIGLLGAAALAAMEDLVDGLETPDARHVASAP
jgi:hypothetical protein